MNNDCGDNRLVNAIGFQSDIFSGLRRMKINAGMRTMISVIAPKNTQVNRQPTETNSAAVTTGIRTLEKP